MDTTARKDQISMTVDALKKEPLTMLMLSKRIGIERANICRYISHLQQCNRVALVRKAVCRITRHYAGYYTSDPALFPQNSQLKLF